MKQEDKIRLWKWCGWRIASKPYEVSFVDGVRGKNIDVEFWYSPDEPNEPQAIPELTLDNLFKYAVPKLQHQLYDVYTCSKCDTHLKKVSLVDVRTREQKTINTEHENLAEALAQAILKVIDNE